MELKKIFSLVFAVIVICCSTACIAEIQHDIDDHSGWIWVQNGTTYGALSDTGYYYINGNVLHYYDFAAKAATVLCATAGCSHDSQDCDGYIRAIGTIPMFFHNNCLYYCPASTVEVYSRNATGAELKKVGDLAVKYAKEKKGVEIDCCAIAGEYLYYQASIMDNVPENGTITTKTEMISIGRLNLSTGKDEILIEEALDKNSETLILCAVRDNGVLFNRWAGINMDTKDPNYTNALQNVEVRLECWNGETDETTVLFQKNRDECININMISEGKVYFAAKLGQNTKPVKYDYNFTYSYDLSTGEERIACAAYTRYQLGGAYILCRDTDGTYFVYNMSTGQKLPNTLEDPSGMQVVNISSKGVVVRAFYEKNTDENGLSTGEMRFFYITHDSLSNGLQETDLQYIYTF